MLLQAIEQLMMRDREAIQDIVVASVFTTRSATAILEKLRDQVKAETDSVRMVSRN